MDQKTIEGFELAAFTREENDDSFALIFTPAEGEPFLLSMGRVMAGTIVARLSEAIQQLERDGVPTSVPRSPDRIMRYNAQRRIEQNSGEPFVIVLMEGERSQPLLGAMTPTDANRLGAALMAAAQSTDGPPRAAN
ncbi:hypothetical protein IVB45_17355 [Bradyrhizobium sp. 4]|uniref:hypothetical protein n=1 Tax=unclassified Bradyrhizobium TaxID=2631580 RepID=UPI001FF8A6FB|nr:MULTISPECIES: hypothetical protein [unclassified Bradyrhizobium]MCK1402058.1 hypothetical protein [Bradyrhizobium sp. 39]MCK1751222.1 hypothetical protein [Bradyrhizobium sp. 135]UPJ38478.1 hypothetical protein IVB45_17355 [Bradyrhizobium sp. 4]